METGISKQLIEHFKWVGTFFVTTDSFFLYSPVFQRIDITLKRQNATAKLIKPIDSGKQGTLRTDTNFILQFRLPLFCASARTRNISTILCSLLFTCNLNDWWFYFSI